uniref:Uncharacterized protein n=1 Tax=Timema poppense TaxID=170557 RepID=A0A7R9DE63_TIMPO|nr:unnamed protein product [Timema poppensis]
MTGRSRFESRGWLKGWFSLCSLLGVTWVFGLAFMEYYASFEYIFVILNGCQWPWGKVLAPGFDDCGLKPVGCDGLFLCDKHLKHNSFQRQSRTDNFHMSIPAILLLDSHSQDRALTMLQLCSNGLSRKCPPKVTVQQLGAQSCQCELRSDALWSTMCRFSQFGFFRQGVFIFLFRCLLNKQVRSSVLNEARQRASIKKFNRVAGNRSSWYIASQPPSSRHPSVGSGLGSSDSDSEIKQKEDYPDPLAVKSLGSLWSPVYTITPVPNESNNPHSRPWLNRGLTEFVNKCPMIEEEKDNDK